MQVFKLDKETAESYYSKRNIDHLLSHIYLKAQLDFTRGRFILTDEIITLKDDNHVIVRGYGKDTWVVEVKVDKTDIIVAMTIVDVSEVDACREKMIELLKRGMLQIVKTRQYFEAASYQEDDIKMKARTGTEHTDNIYNCSALIVKFYPIGDFKHSSETNKHLDTETGKLANVLGILKEAEPVGV